MKSNEICDGLLHEIRMKAQRVSSGCLGGPQGISRGCLASPQDVPRGYVSVKY